MDYKSRRDKIEAEYCEATEELADQVRTDLLIPLCRCFSLEYFSGNNCFHLQPFNTSSLPYYQLKKLRIVGYTPSGFGDSDGLKGWPEALRPPEAPLDWSPEGWMEAWPPVLKALNLSVNGDLHCLGQWIQSILEEDVREESHEGLEGTFPATMTC